MPPAVLKGNAAIGQSGGPTAVINQSLVGVIEGLRATLAKRGVVKRIYGMRHGVNGLIQDPPALVDMTRFGAPALNRLAVTPSASLGSSRDKPDVEYCRKILDACARNDIRYFFYIGGNDSSDTCRIVSELAQKTGHDLRCFHVPKTVDNDLMGNDHTPGYPSAARYVATAFAADALDNASLPGIKINVVMGRHAGFLTAAAALARTCFGGGAGAKKGFEPGPHLIYVPEVRVDKDRFLADVEGVYRRLGRCQIAVSEGVLDKEGRPVIVSLLPQAEVDPHGNVQLSGTGALGDALAEIIKTSIRRSDGRSVRVRADTFGYLQRCWPDASPVDQKEARASGSFAAKLAARGERSGSVAIVRAKGKSYRAEYRRQELSDVAAKTRHLPEEFIEGHCNVSKKFIDYALPLVGKLPRFETV